MTQETDTQKKAHVVQPEPEIKKDSIEKKPEVVQVKPEIQNDAAEKKTESAKIERKPVLDNVEDDIKRSGIKEVVADSEAIAIEQDKKKVVEKEVLPSFFVNKEERKRIELDILSGREDGKIMSVSRTGLGLDFNEFKFLRHETAWFDFTMPSYEDMSTYRQRCGVYRREAGQVLVDKLQLRNFILVWHLKDWSLTDSDGNKIELKHDSDGSLSDESLKKVYSVHTTLLDVLLTIFEKDVLLT